MKRSFAIIAASTVFLSSATLAQSVGEKTGVNSALGIAPKTEDFIKEAAMSDMLEIEAAKIAQQKGNATEKTFAGADDHRSHQDQFRTQGHGLRRHEGGLPDRARRFVAEEARQAEDAKPEDFAAQYDPMQVSAHKDATSLFERYAKGGDDPKLKDWAGQDAPRSAAPSRNGAGYEQEPKVGTKSRPRAASPFCCRAPRIKL